MNQLDNIEYGWYDQNIPDIVNQLIWLLDQKPESEACLTDIIERWYNSLYSELLETNEFECCPIENYEGDTEALQTLISTFVFASMQTALVSGITASLAPLGGATAVRAARQFTRLLIREVRRLPR